jgi:hypothetical protein
MTPGFRLPLNNDEFRHAIRAGLGRALLHVKAHGIAGLEDILIESCVKNTAWDPQCESDRAAWNFEIVEAADGCDLIVPPVCGELATTTNTWDVVHTSELALRLARRGYEQAREALYSAFDAQRVREDWAGGREIVELDGADGLLHVAQRLGARLRSDPDFRIDAWLRDISEQKLGAEVVRRLLDSAGQHDADVRTYFEALYTEPGSQRCSPFTTNLTAAAAALTPDSRSRHEARQRKLAEVPFEDVDRAIRDPSRPPLSHPGNLSDWGKAAPEEEIRKAAAALCESDPVVLVKLLNIFSKRAIPQFEPVLLGLLDHPDETVRHRARYAMHETTHPAIRNEALARLSRRPLDYTPLDLLYSNVELGDAARIFAGLPDCGDPEQLHDLVFPIVNLFRRHPLLDAADCLVWAWDKSPCSMCRGTALEVLLKLDAVPPWLAAEARSDSDSSIRQAVAGFGTA